MIRFYIIINTNYSKIILLRVLSHNGAISRTANALQILHSIIANEAKWISSIVLDLYMHLIVISERLYIHEEETWKYYVMNMDLLDKIFRSYSVYMSYAAFCSTWKFYRSYRNYLQKAYKTQIRYSFLLINKFD